MSEHSAPLVPLEGYVSIVTQQIHSEAIHHYFPKARNFPGKFWKVASGSHHDTENIELVPRMQVTPKSPAKLEKTQQEAGLQVPSLHQLVTVANCTPSPVPSLTICKVLVPGGQSTRVAGLLQPVRCKIQ